MRLLVALLLGVWSQVDATIVVRRAGTTSTSTSTSSTSTSTSSTSTTGATTSSTTTSTSSTSTSSTTTTLDGAAIYNVGVTNASTAHIYFGGDPTTTVYTLTTPHTLNHHWWITGRSYTRVTGTAWESGPAGTGTGWDVILYYSESALATTESCADRAASTVSVTLCTITGSSDTSCTFDKDLTTFNSSVGIVAGSCFQVGFVETGVGGTNRTPHVALNMRESSGDGISAFASSATTSTNNSDWMAWKSAGTTAAAADVNEYWSTPKALSACTGAMAVVTAPGGGGSWAYDIGISTAGKTSGQSCLDLTYTNVTGCTVSGSNKNCKFALAAASVPANGCISAKRIATSSPTTSGGETWALECSTTDTTEPAVTGGAVFTGGKTGNIPSATWYAGPGIETSATGGSTFEPSWWVTGSDAFTTCSGVFDGGTVGSTGSASYAVALRYSTSSLGVGETCNDGGLAFTTTSTLCTLTLGTTKHCSFSNASVSIPANACVQLQGTLSGSVTTAMNKGEWTVTCTK
jgi:hypothetical protein